MREKRGLGGRDSRPSDTVVGVEAIAEPPSLSGRGWGRVQILHTNRFLDILAYVSHGSGFARRHAI